MNIPSNNFSKIDGMQFENCTLEFISMKFILLHYFVCKMN